MTGRSGLRTYDGRPACACFCFCGLSQQRMMPVVPVLVRIELVDPCSRGCGFPASHRAIAGVRRPSSCCCALRFAAHDILERSQMCRFILPAGCEVVMFSQR